MKLHLLRFEIMFVKKDPGIPVQFPELQAGAYFPRR